MARRKSGGGGGAPEWLVTFADLMSLLVCFFVLIISFSIQDEKKLQIVAGSMREAFGTQTEIRGAGLVERDGLPDNPKVRETTRLPTPLGANTDEVENDARLAKQGPQSATHDVAMRESQRRSFMMATTSLRQALQDMPDIAELSKSIVMHIDENGLNIELIDLDGRAMFPSSSVQPYPFARDVIARIAPVLRELPNRIMVTGHTSFRPGQSDPSGAGWPLSAGRADAVREVLTTEGVRADRFAAIVGKADTEPLFPNDPTLAANRRVTILLMNEEPPLPPELSP
jgi:chemotaxis protein MotB